MQPAYEKLLWYRNAPEAASFTLMDGDNPYDLTGRTLRLHVRIYPGAPGVPLASLGMAFTEADPGFWIDAPLTGTFSLRPPTSDDLEDLPLPADITTGLLDTLAYDILLISGGGVPELLLEGTIILKSGVTLI